jgi:soluble lytic murein transglycosylase
VSSVGARGLLQVLTSTAREVTRRAGWQDLPSRSELLDPRTSVAVAALALREWHADPGPCFAPVAVAYAAGPGKVRRWVRGSAPVAADVWLARMPYPTVRNYAREVETASVAYATLEHQPVPSEGRCVVGG